MRRIALVISAAAVLAVTPWIPAANALNSDGYIVTRIALSTRATAIADDPSTGRVYVGGQGKLTVIDGASETVESAITLLGTVVHIGVDPATDTVYAADGSLNVIDGESNTVIASVPSIDGQIAVDAATDMVYAGARLPNNTQGIAVIDGATNSITATLPLPSTALAVDPATDTIYAAGLDGTLSAIDGATNTVTKSVQLGLGARVTSLAFDSSVGSVYAVDEGHNAIDVLDAATLTTTAAITGCAYHVAAAEADPTANVVFVSSSASLSAGPADSTCVINALTNTVAEMLPRGGIGVAADPNTGAAYIAAWNPLDNIWVATPSNADELSPVVYGFGPNGFGSPSATLAAGVSSSFPLLVSALPAATLTEAGALPAGIAMSPAGVFSGTPAAGTLGTYPITVTASNGISPNSSASLSIVVDIAPTFTSPANAIFQTGEPGSFTVEASGTPAPTLQAVDYPTWLTFTLGSSSGVFSGTPPPGSGGMYSVYLYANNGSGFVASQTLNLTVNQPPAIVAASHLTFRTGRHVRYRIASTGFPAPVLHERGLLPRGLAFRARTNGVAFIVGTPARSDKGKRYSITIVARNHIGNANTKIVTIRIR